MPELSSREPGGELLQDLPDLRPVGASHGPATTGAARVEVRLSGAEGLAEDHLLPLLVEESASQRFSSSSMRTWRRVFRATLS
jgi:hypothetical protein